MTIMSEQEPVSEYAPKRNGTMQQAAIDIPRAQQLMTGTATAIAAKAATEVTVSIDALEEIMKGIKKDALAFVDSIDKSSTAVLQNIRNDAAQFVASIQEQSNDLNKRVTAFTEATQGIASRFAEMKEDIIKLAQP
jgi:chaperonin cofactor prefoldin